MNSSEISVSQNQQFMNDKISQRTIPTHTLSPNLSVRPVPTKYVKLNTTDIHSECKEKKITNQPYQSHKMFCPTSQNVNYAGYANNIHLENELRNQHYALQKSDQHEYVPSSNSSLYQYSTPSSSLPQEFSYLFDNSIYMPVESILTQSSQALFNNHTRYQK